MSVHHCHVFLKILLMNFISSYFKGGYTLQGTNISPKNGILKMIFLFPRWDLLIPCRVPNKYPPYKVYMGLIIMYRYHPKGTDSKTRSLASNRMEKNEMGISPMKQDSLNGTHFGGSNNANLWVVFRDFPCKSVLFGLVKS